VTSILVLEMTQRSARATAERFLHRVLDGEGVAEPRVVITDKLASYSPATRQPFDRCCCTPSIGATSG